MREKDLLPFIERRKEPKLILDGYYIRCNPHVIKDIAVFLQGYTQFTTISLRYAFEFTKKVIET